MVVSMIFSTFRRCNTVIFTPFGKCFTKASKTIWKRRKKKDLFNDWLFCSFSFSFLSICLTWIMINQTVLKLLHIVSYSFLVVHLVVFFCLHFIKKWIWQISNKIQRINKENALLKNQTNKNNNNNDDDWYWFDYYYKELSTHCAWYHISKAIQWTEKKRKREHANANVILPCMAIDHNITKQQIKQKNKSKQAIANQNQRYVH